MVFGWTGTCWHLTWERNALQIFTLTTKMFMNGYIKYSIIKEINNYNNCTHNEILSQKNKCTAIDEPGEGGQDKNM